MATMDPDELVEAVAGQIDTVLGGNGWRRSNHLIGQPSDGRGTRHRSYAVGLGESVPDARSRQRGDVLTQTRVVVQWWWKNVSPTARPADYAALLSAERGLVATIRATTSTGKLHSILLERIMPRIVEPDGTYMGELRFIAQHKYDLTVPS